MSITIESLKSKRKNELKDIAQGYGLNTKGLRWELEDRIRAHLIENEEEIIVDSASDSTPARRPGRKLSTSSNRSKSKKQSSPNGGGRASEEESEASEVEIKQVTTKRQNNMGDSYPYLNQQLTVGQLIQEVAVNTRYRSTIITEETSTQRGLLRESITGLNNYILRLRKEYSNTRTFIQCIIFFELSVFLYCAIEWNLKIATIPIPSFMGMAESCDLHGPDIFVIVEWHRFWRPLTAFLIYLLLIPLGFSYVFNLEPQRHSLSPLAFSVAQCGIFLATVGHFDWVEDVRDFIPENLIYAGSAQSIFFYVAEIASRKFLDELEVVAISSQTDLFVKQRLIGILGELSQMFQDEPSLWPISDLYGRLIGESIPRPRQVEIDPQRRTISSIPTQAIPAKPSIEQIMDDVELAKNNTQLFAQMISFTDPENEDITKNELIQEFRGKCEALSKRIIQYISEMQDEQWLSTLISTNQEIMNTFKMYDEMVERGHVTMAKNKSRDAAAGIDYENEDPDNCAGVGGSGTSQLDPFSDLNELRSDTTIPRKSERSKGKKPASIYYDEDIFNEDESDKKTRSQYPPNLTECSRPNDNRNDINGRQEHAVI
ncbi:6127_t:CDS:10 [Acaulospora colombiana]|uniref:6127_t:CDS:1 n=1 Tax=Acaulospora colombiana TaxID=27376 RepID=A0ACA9KY81_9GLOM|nr:6127_t:CDS:10 [Acaulospora colombiana]